jgi:transposase InsO family protein
VKLYPFIEAEKAADHNVVKACELLGVSRSAFYIWAQHVPSQHQLDDAELGERIEEIHTESRLTYGAPRIHQVLKREGIHVGRKRVARIMVQKGLVGRCRKRWRKTTIADEEAQKAAELLKRKFGPGATEQDRIYVGDITYIRTWEGWLYLATVIDLSSRRIVGWAMADHMRTELVGDALKMAIDARKPPAGLIFHSDRGSQYTSKDFAELCRMNNITQSMSRKGECWDNAVAEAFFGTLKNELVDVYSWPTRRRAKGAIFSYIEGFYNTKRLHSSLDYMNPADYEVQQRNKRNTAQAA